MHVHHLRIVMPLAMPASPLCGDESAEQAPNLEGTWVIQSVLRDPREQSPDEGNGLRIIVSGNRIVAQLPGQKEPVGTMKFRQHPRQEPPILEFFPDNETVRAIYELDGNSLRVCWSTRKDALPTEFAAKPGSRHTLVRLQRAAP